MKSLETPSHNRKIPNFQNSRKARFENANNGLYFAWKIFPRSFQEKLKSAARRKMTLIFEVHEKFHRVAIRGGRWKMHQGSEDLVVFYSATLFWDLSLIYISIGCEEAASGTPPAIPIYTERHQRTLSYPFHDLSRLKLHLRRSPSTGKLADLAPSVSSLSSSTTTRKRAQLGEIFIHSLTFSAPTPLSPSHYFYSFYRLCILVISRINGEILCTRFIIQFWDSTQVVFNNQVYNYKIGITCFFMIKENWKFFM